MSDYSPMDLIREDIARWKASLAALRMENIRMKNELSDIIKKEIDASLLEKAEDFHQRFVQEDLLMDLLRLDLNHLLRQINMAEPADHLSLHRLIGNDMDKLVAGFNILKEYFHDFVTVAHLAT